MRFPIVAVFAVLISGCASRPGSDILDPVGSSATGAEVVTVYAATTRKREKDGTNRFTSERSAQTNYAEFAISFPPGRKPGEIEWSKGRPDPTKEVAVLNERALDEKAFLHQIVKSQGGGKRDVAVFVHGYNYTFQEALFRQAQMVIDGKYKGAAVLFSWPSQATVSGYLADKDSANYSRDNLAKMLTSLARERRVGDIVVYAHSMGAWLTVEAMRQLRLSGRNDVLDRLHVLLASPDIDVDVFEAQMRVIGPLRKALTVLISADDRALRLSKRVAGENDRLGGLNINDPRIRKIAKESNIAVVDISSLDASDDFKHDRFVTLAAVYADRRHLGKADPSRSLMHAGAFVFNGIGATISSPFTLVGETLAVE
ncbi:alpha/beta hydrolase [Agrobacterium sp. NPDC089420]|uniref:alpha/beta hydrolase n=1 Tax=Agrobacterium sp. NPDC089420 TaxID=3363918 RepID=UPI00384F33A6